MTKGHYHHHIEEATGEPTVIEIGEPYPEELDPQLHEFNRLRGAIVDAIIEERARERDAGVMHWAAPNQAHPQTRFLEARGKVDRLIREYGKMVPGEWLDPQLHRGTAHKGMRIIRECIEAIRGANSSTLTDRNKRDVMDRELGKIERTLDEYEKGRE